MKFRKHHNNKGRRQIQRGKTETQLQYIAKKLGIKYISTLEENMSEHITKEEFYNIIDNDGMFKLITEDESQGLFYGTSLDFANCFFTNVTYHDVCGFADENGMVVAEYTDEEHLQYMIRKG
jgi:hypothetical protein